MDKPSRKLKIAYLALPKPSGTYTFLKFMQQNSVHDWYSIGVGKQEYNLIDHNRKFKNHIHLKPEEENDLEILKSLQTYLNNSDFDIVFPMNSPYMGSLIKNKSYLKPKVYFRVADNTHFGYKRVFPKLNPDSPRYISTPRQGFFLRLLGVSKKNLVHLPHSARSNDNPSQRKKIEQVTFIGRFEDKQKGVFTLVLLAFYLRKFPQIQLNLVGDGVHKNLVISVLNLVFDKNNIKTYSSLDSKGLTKIYTKSDLIFFPSFHEGFGYVLVEAMSHGCVILARRIKGVTDYILQNKNQMFNSWNLHSRLKKIVSESEQNIAKISLANIKNYEHRFKDKLIIDKWDQSLIHQLNGYHLEQSVYELKSSITIRSMVRLRYLLRLKTMICLKKILRR